MNKNLKDALDQPIAKFFRGKHFAFVGTVNKDGSPQVTPTWIDLREDGKLLINTAEGRIKQKNVSRDPRVSISIINEENPYSIVTIKGWLGKPPTVPTNVSIIWQSDI